MSPLFPISQACMRTNHLACLLQYWFSSVALNLLVCISGSRRFRGLRGWGWRYFGRRISLSAYEERCVWVPPGHTGTIIQQEWNLWGSIAGAVGGRQWWVWGRLRTVVPVPSPANLPQWRGRTHTVRTERRWRVWWGPSSWPKSLRRWNTTEQEEFRMWTRPWAALKPDRQ